MHVTERIVNALHTQTCDPSFVHWRGLQLIFRMHNSDPTPQSVENRNILLWIKCVLTALHVNCMILSDKVL
jgi:hypothetical protein